MSDRRMFLTLLGGAMLHRLAPKIVFDPKILVHPVSARLLSLEGMTGLIDAELRRILSGPEWYWSNGARGMIADDRMFNVHLRVPVGEERFLRQDYIEPAAGVLAEYLRRKGVRRLAPPPATSQTVSAGVLRGVHQYNLVEDAHFLRFDVIGGA